MAPPVGGGEYLISRRRDFKITSLEDLLSMLDNPAHSQLQQSLIHQSVKERRNLVPVSSRAPVQLLRSRSFGPSKARRFTYSCIIRVPNVSKASRFTNVQAAEFPF